MENHMKYSYFGDGQMSPWGEQIYFFPCLSALSSHQQAVSFGWSHLCEQRLIMRFMMSLPSKNPLALRFCKL